VVRVRCRRRCARACRVVSRRFVTASTRTRRVSAPSLCPPFSSTAHVHRSSFPLAAPCTCPRVRPTHMPSAVPSSPRACRPPKFIVRVR
jgi:hypothetical protein